MIIKRKHFDKLCSCATRVCVYAILRISTLRTTCILRCNLHRWFARARSSRMIGVLNMLTRCTETRTSGYARMEITDHIILTHCDRLLLPRPSPSIPSNYCARRYETFAESHSCVLFVSRWEAQRYKGTREEEEYDSKLQSRSLESKKDSAVSRDETRKNRHGRTDKSAIVVS